MKILITSYVFAPSVGGIETASAVMAEAFVQRGHEVRVVTQTKEKCPNPLPYQVLRAPSVKELWNAVAWANVVWQNNTALTYLWAPIVQAKPTVVTLQCAVFREYPHKYWQERIKALLLRRCHVIAISRYVTTGLSCCAQLQGNPFEPAFRTAAEGVERNLDLVFLGRLVSDKGADLLIEALGRLARAGLKVKTTIIGDGPELENLKAQAQALELGEQIRFTGYMTRAPLHKEIARHRVMVIPSRWNEPFGIVALEGIAAGCAVIASEGGGLPEAVGPCGVTFQNNNADELTEAIRDLIEHPEKIETMTVHAEKHLARFSIDAQAEAYLNTFRKLADHT